MLTKLLRMLAVATVGSTWLLLAPQAVRQASADAPQWVGWVEAVHTEIRTDPDHPVSFTWSSRFTLFATAADTAETTFSGVYQYSSRNYENNVIAGRYLSHQVTGNGSGSGTGATISVDFAASDTGAGYHVAATGGTFPLTTTEEYWFLSAPFHTSNTVTADFPTFTGSGGFFPSAADDRYMVEGSAVVSGRCFEADCIKDEISFALGRVSCVGGPDANGDGITDDDGFNACRERDRRSDASRPDSDGDGIPDESDTDTTATGAPVVGGGGSESPGSDDCSGFLKCLPWKEIGIVVVVAAVVVAAVVVLPGLAAGGVAAGGVAAAAEGASLVATATEAAAATSAATAAADGAGIATAAAAQTAITTKAMETGVEHVATTAAEDLVGSHEDPPPGGGGGGGAR